MSFGLSETGFNRKRLADIKDEIETELKNIWGDNIDLTPQSNFGQLVGIFSERFALAWELSEGVYLSQYPSTATGVQLDNVVQLNGITRQNATKSTVALTISGTDGTTIPAGSLVSVVNTENKFVTLSEVVIAGGSVSVIGEAENAGAVQATAGTITVIETPIFGWQSVTNAGDAEVGQNMETDAELRARRVASTMFLATNMVDSLFAQLSNIDGVLDALVLDNKTDIVDANGIPAHNFMAIVEGGDNADIAQAIWNNTPQGVDSHGSTTEQITDAQGFSQDVNFTRPTIVPIYHRIDITTNIAEFPGTGVSDIKQAVTNYGEAQFKIGDDVVLSEFYGAINTIPGILSIDLRIGLAASPTGTSNLPITITELSDYDTTQVEVNIV